MTTRDQLKEELSKELVSILENDSTQTTQNQEEIEKETGETEEVESAQEEVEESENEEENEEVETPDEEDETQDSENSEQSLLDLDRQLSGHTKEFKELVKSITDPTLQNKILEVGKISRAREDKFASELGEVKKQYQSIASFKDMLERSPQDTILQIADMAKIDLKSLVEPAVENEDDYYLDPETKALKQKMENIERELQRERFERQKQEQEQIDREIQRFYEDKENYPYFEDAWDSIIDLVSIERQKKGAPLTSQERIERLEKAYKKAILLDENLLKKRDSDLLAKLERERKEKVDKAKKLKKVVTKSANNPIEPSDRKEALRLEFEKQGLI